MARLGVQPGMGLLARTRDRFLLLVGIAWVAIAVPMLVSLLFIFVWPFDEDTAVPILLFLGLAIWVAIGGGARIVHRRWLGAELMRVEAERWLKARSTHRPDWRMRYRWTLWVPTLLALLYSGFQPEAHNLFFRVGGPSCARVHGYELRVPFSWSISPHDDLGSNPEWSVSTVQRARGLVQSAAHGEWTVFSAREHIGFYGDRRDDSAREGPPVGAIAKPFASGTIGCIETHDPYSQLRFLREQVTVRCWTYERDFHAYFTGEKRSAPEFYRMLQDAKRTK